MQCIFRKYVLKPQEWQVRRSASQSSSHSSSSSSSPRSCGGSPPPGAPPPPPGGGGGCGAAHAILRGNCDTTQHLHTFRITCLRMSPPQIGGHIINHVRLSVASGVLGEARAGMERYGKGWCGEGWYGKGWCGVGVVCNYAPQHETTITNHNHVAQQPPQQEVATCQNTMFTQTTSYTGG
jgi:hypothetical protein